MKISIAHEPFSPPLVGRENAVEYYESFPRVESEAHSASTLSQIKRELERNALVL